MLAQHGARQREGDVGILARNDAGGGTFVCGIRATMEEADDDRFRPGLAQPAGGLAHLLEIDRMGAFSCSQDTLGHFEPPLARNQRSGPPGTEVVELRPRLPADRQHVAEAARRDHAQPCALPLEQRIGGDRSTVCEQDDLGGAGARHGQHARHALKHALVLAARHRRDLRVCQAAGLLAEQHHIGKGPATSIPSRYVGVLTERTRRGDTRIPPTAATRPRPPRARPPRATGM